MSIAQAQAMRKAREDIEALKAQIAALTEKVDHLMGLSALDDALSLSEHGPLVWSADATPMEAGAMSSPWSPHADASIPPAAWDATPPPFDPDLIYNISPPDAGPPIFNVESIVSANIATPPKKRGRPPKA